VIARPSQQRPSSRHHRNNTRSIHESFVSVNRQGFVPPVPSKGNKEGTFLNRNPSGPTARRRRRWRPRHKRWSATRWRPKDGGPLPAGEEQHMANEAERASRVGEPAPAGSICNKYHRTANSSGNSRSAARVAHRRQQRIISGSRSRPGTFGVSS
jgi:hypothetical protein